MTYIEMSTHVARLKMSHVRVSVCNVYLLVVSQFFFISILSPKKNEMKKSTWLVSESHSSDNDSGEFISRSFVKSVTSSQVIIALCIG